MQIQAPRTVLAEAAMDCLFLSYADPALAAEVMLGHFESAPHPQQPCMREDGSYNMVADDGQICGTAPEWGYPLWCCDQLFRRTGDLDWLRRLYPHAAAFMRWWLEHRRDAEGWIGLRLLVGERSGCLQPLWAATNGRHHHSACASSGFAGECRIER